MGQFTDSFLRGLFAALGVEDSARNRSFMTEWERWEGAATRNNPLATTQGWQGATNFNSAGVKNYATEQDGIAATATTLTNGRYENVLRFLRGENVPGTELAQDVRTWGTTGFANQLAGGVLPESGTALTTEMPPGTDLGGTTATEAPPGGDEYQDWIIRAGKLYPRWNQLVTKMTQAEEAGAIWLPEQGWVSETYAQDPITGATTVTGQTVWVTPEEYDEFTQLDGQVFDLEQEFETQFGTQALDDFITRQEYIWSSDPQQIDATNAANRYGREFDIVTEAAKIAADRFNSQADHYTLFLESQAAAGGGKPSGGGPIVGSPGRLVTFEAMFDQALAKLRDELPELVDVPYYPPGAPPEVRSIGAARQEAIGSGGGAATGSPPGIASTAASVTPAARITGTGRGLARADAAMGATAGPGAAPPPIPGRSSGPRYGSGPRIPGTNIGVLPKLGLPTIPNIPGVSFGFSPRETPTPAANPFTGAIIDRVRGAAQDVRNLQRIRGSVFR